MQSSPSLDDLFDTDEEHEDVAAKAQWCALISQLKRAMREANVSRDEMARRMNMTSTQLDHLMTCGGEVIPLTVLHRAAAIVGRDIKLELV